MRKTAVHPHAILLSLALAGLLAGCAGLSGVIAHDREKERLVEAHVFDQDPNMLWTAARDMFEGMDFALVAGDAEQLHFTTDRQERSTGTGRERIHYRFAVEPDEAGSVVVIQRFRERPDLGADSWSEWGSGRDLDMEFRLIELVDPDGAAEILAAAEAAEEAARAE
jgi:hypothetical protein